MRTEKSRVRPPTEGVSVVIDHAYRSGTSGSGRVTLVPGRVRIAMADALSERDKADGSILGGQVAVRGEVTVDV